MQKSKFLRILYIGNKLKKWGNNPTSVEFLGDKLASKYEIIRVSNRKNIFLRLIHIWASILFYNRQYDIILIDTYSTKSFHFAWTSAKLARILNKKYISILHGGNLPERLKSSKAIFLKMLSGAYVTVSPSEYLKQSLVSIEELPIEVIPNPIEIARYPFRLRKRLSKTMTILWLRAFDQIYNPQLAIRLISKLHNLGYKDITLKMIGPDKDGSMKICKNLAITLGIENYVEFTGGLNFADWLQIATQSDLFINTTNVDNMPVSLIEAMALGIPILSSNVGGIPFLVDNEQNGILVAPNDLDGFVNKTLELMGNPSLYEKLSWNGRVRSEQYSWEAVCPKWDVILSED